MYYANGSSDSIDLWLEGPSFIGKDIEHRQYMGLFMIDTITGWVCGDTGKLWRMPALVTNLDGPGVPKAMNLCIHEVYPNPISMDIGPNDITVEYSLNENSDLYIDVVDILGINRVAVVEIRNTNPGRYLETISVNNLKKGIYFIKIYAKRHNIKYSDEVRVIPFVVK
jgi:hypothetical protein